MSSNLYNILSVVDSICETYEQKCNRNESNESNENKENEQNERKDNIRYIRNILNFRNLNDNYNNNRNIISNVFQRGTTSNVLSLFITKYINNRNHINNEENKEFKEMKFSDLDSYIKNINNTTNIMNIKKDDCSICFEAFNQNDFVTVTKCDHIYHKNCIEEWIKMNKTCPLCRRNI